MTEKLFHSEPYAVRCGSRVAAIGPSGGILVDRSVFFAGGGGQPGDSGWLKWDSGDVQVLDARKAPDDGIELILESGAGLPPVGAHVEQELDWPRRFRHMRMHTALHLLSAVIPLPVTSGAISEEKGRLDFDMPEPLQDRGLLESKLNGLISRELPVTEDWITDGKLAENPGLVKTMSVKPPTGTGRVRLIRIGSGEDQVDLQPCGGTHVSDTSEIGNVRLGKIEKKGKRNRRFNIFLD